MRHTEGTFEGAKGRSIYWQGWLPDSEPKDKLLVCHGASEHSGRYRYLVEHLVPKGWAVYAHDQRGHGRSEGRRAQLDRIGYAVADLDHMVGMVTAEGPRGQPILLGHSVGGTVSIEYAIEHQDKLRALALSSPLAAVEAASLPLRVAARVLSAATPNLALFSIEPGGVSRDPEEVAEYEHDPLNYHGRLPVRTVAELAGVIDTFPINAPRITLPLLVMIGTADPLAPNEGGRMVYERAASADKTLKVYEGFFHELINEPKADRDRVLDDLAGWLDAH